MGGTWNASITRSLLPAAAFQMNHAALAATARPMKRVAMRRNDAQPLFSRCLQAHLLELFAQMVALVIDEGFPAF